MKLLKRFIYEPQHEKTDEKVTDQALTRSIVISVVGILFCMTCLFGLTWAWFSDSVVTSSNKITAATFDLDIKVTEVPEATEQGSETPVNADENGSYTLGAVEAEKNYQISLKKLGEAKTGFCLISVKVGDSTNATPYYTKSIPYADDKTVELTDPYVFNLSVSANTEVHISFTPMWGKYPEGQENSIVGHGETLSFGAPEEVDGEETEQEEPELEDDSPAQNATPSTTEKQQSESVPPSTEPTTPETNATEPPVTEKSESTESPAQTESTKP